MSENTKMKKLINTLLSRTQNGQVSWDSASNEGSFIWSAKSGSVMVFPTDNDGRAPWSVRLIAGDGQTIEEESYDGGDEDYEIAYDLYRAARSNALDIDRTIDSLLNELGTE